MSVIPSNCDNYVVQMEKSLKKNVTYSDIAEKLLEDKLLLTALELHSELIQNGKEVRVLRDYFSNPINFEPQTQEVTNRLCKYIPIVFKIV